MSEELKPCPFCGSEDIWLIFDNTIVECRKCSVIASPSQWNTRYDPELREDGEG